MPKELTLRDVCLEQMARLNKTLGYPDNKLAMNDYCAALEVMETFEGVRSLIDDLTRTDLIRMPTAAAIRGMAYDRTKETRALRASCDRCGGSGVQTVWLLQTYAGKSHAMKGRAYLPQITNQEQADEFARNLQKFLDKNQNADRQMVLSTARECSCRKRVLAG